MKQSTFALVGCGRIGQRHIEMIRNLEGSELVATCDLKTASELGLAGDHPHYQSLDELLAAHQVDVLAIASPMDFTQSRPLLALTQEPTLSSRSPWP